MPAMRTESASFIAHGLVQEGGGGKEEGGWPGGSFIVFFFFLFLLLSTALSQKCWFPVLHPSVSALHLPHWILGVPF